MIRTQIGEVIVLSIVHNSSRSRWLSGCLALSSGFSKLLRFNHHYYHATIARITKVASTALNHWIKRGLLTIADGYTHTDVNAKLYPCSQDCFLYPRIILTCALSWLRWSKLCQSSKTTSRNSPSQVCCSRKRKWRTHAGWHCVLSFNSSNNSPESTWLRSTVRQNSGIIDLS